MRRPYGRYRRTVFRTGRRFIVCGLRRPVPTASDLAPLPFGWRLRATVLIAAVVVGFVAIRPPAVPAGTQPPPLSMARYSIDDFANASRFK